MIPSNSRAAAQRQQGRPLFGRSCLSCFAVLGLIAAMLPECQAWSASPSSRRKFFSKALSSGGGAAAALLWTASNPAPAAAADDTATATPVITDKVYVEFKGLETDPTVSSTSRIVIGLYGKDAPEAVSQLKQLMNDNDPINGGLPAVCKPKEVRNLQREQLEANKVYNACLENESKGVTYDLSQVWRIVKNERIDVGAVSGKFVARQYPTWSGGNPKLTHDTPGTVSVLRGNEGGFGFTIFPGNPKQAAAATEELNQSHIVVGKVLEGMDVVQTLNQTPVVTSASINYMSLTGGPNNKAAPSRACRYGGPMYCNEFKPLKKILISKTGLI